MLEGIRKRRNSVMILLAFAAIIVVFIFWGVGPKGDGENAVVATVDGTEIPARDYVSLYRKEVDYYKKTLKDRFTDEMAKKMNLKQAALDILVNRALAMKEAKSQGIKVSDNEVQDAIKSIPAFMKNGTFDKDLYFSLLSSNRVKPAEFEKGIEQDLLTSKVRESVVKDVKASDAEVRDLYMKENRKLDFEYMTIDWSRFKGDVKVTDEEARNFLKVNGSEFMAPARVKAFIAYIGYASLTAGEKVTDKELKDFYDKNQKEYELPRMVKGRHILIRPDEKAVDGAKAKKEAKDKAEGILKKIQAGANFAEMARKHSQDPGSAKQGGDLGWFQKGIMIKPFEDAAFALKKNEVSGVVESEFGFHIIKADEVKEGGVVPFSGARESIRSMLVVQKAQAKAKEALAAMQNPFKEAKSVEDLKKAASRQKNVKATLTGFFTEADRKAVNDVLRDTLLAMKPGEVTRPILSHDGVYIAKVMDRVEAHVEDYKDVSSRVKEMMTANRAAELAKNKAEAMLKRLKSGEDFSKIAREEKLKVERTGYFIKAQGFIPRVNVFAGDNAALFDLSAKSPVYHDVITNNGKYYLLRLASSKEADEAGFDRVKAELANRLLMQKQEEAVNKWLKELRSKAKIKVNEKML